MAMRMVFMGGPPDNRKLTFRDRLKMPFTVFGSLPRALKIVWDTQPVFTLIISLATLIQALIPATAAWVAKLTIDSIVTSIAQPSVGLSLVLQPITFGIAIAIVGLSLNSLSQFSQDVLRDLLTLRINGQVIEKAISLDLETFETPHKQDMLERAIRDSSFRPLMMLQQTFSLIQSTITLITLIGLMLRFNVWVVLLLLLTGAPALLLQSKFARDSFSMQSGRAPYWRRLMYYFHVLTASNYVKEIKLFGLGQLLLGRYKALYEQFMKENRALAIKRSLAGIGLQLLGQAGYYSAYLLVIQQTLNGRLTLGDLTLYSAVLMQAPMLVQGMMFTIANLYEQNLFIGNLFAFLALQPRVPPNSDGQPAPETLKRGIEFRNVSFRYPGAPADTLHNINLTLRPGEKIALVGENGAGKTTLVKLLARLYDPTDGAISLDGYDLRELDTASLQKRIGVIFQDFVQYQLAARENVGFGQVEALDDLARIQAAARKSGADSFLSALPDGYDSMLGRWFLGPGQMEGNDLSIGQWQKVALARAFMRDAPILILDEPTASLDARAEYEVFTRFRELAADRTALIISHRFSTVRMADRIIVLEKGTIVEQGTHDQLIAHGGMYATLFNLQAEGYR